jgi:hypothetical protein
MVQRSAVLKFEMPLSQCVVALLAGKVSKKVDGKDARIVSVLARQLTVELAPTLEFNLSCFGESVCIARALIPIKRGTNGKWFDALWTPAC